MHPVLVHLGSIPIHTYGAMGALGFLVVTWMVLRRSAALGMKREHVVDVIFWGSLAAIFGSRLLFVLQNLERMDSVGRWFDFRSGGLVFYGALLVGLPAIGLILWRHKLPFYAFMDLTAAALPIGHGLSRLGCYFAGCCYGVPTDVPWAITFTDPRVDAPVGVPLHPTQLYAALYLFAIGAVLNWFYARRRFDGQVMLLYLVLYSVARSLNELVRGDAERGFLLEEQLGQVISFSQGISLLVAAVALGIFFFGARKASETGPTGE